MTDGFIPQEPPEDWNGRFSLLEDIDRWFVVAHCVDHAKPLIACTPTREEAIGAGRRIAGELLAKRIPERIWTASGYSFARELKKQGAWYDPLFHSWYFPDEKRALANPGMVCAALRKAQSLRAAYVSELVRSSSPARWIELDVPFKDKERVRAAGAVWNGRSRKWLVSSVGPLKEFADWLPKIVMSKGLPHPLS